MLRRSLLSLAWLGGTAGTTALGLDTRNRSGQFVNLIAEGTQNRTKNSASQSTSENAKTHATIFHPAETRQLLLFSSATGRNNKIGIPRGRNSKWNRSLRPDLYDELLKLPLRFALHDFAVLQRHLANNVSSRAAVKCDAAAIAGDEKNENKKIDNNNKNNNNNSNNNNNNYNEEEKTEDEGLYKWGKNHKKIKKNKADETSEIFEKIKSEETDDGEKNPPHPFYAVAGRVSSVGYAPPLGPADPLDTIPFFVHRGSNGQLPGTLHSMNARNLMPAFVLKIENSVEGDLFRFEEELMKLFPTKKIFVRSHCVYVYNVGKDGQTVLHHWLLGLGF